MTNIKLNIKGSNEFVFAKEIEKIQSKIMDCQNTVLNKSGKGKEFLGWVNLPSKTEKKLLDEIISTANKIKNKAEIFVVIGIGGSYLGARSVIEALKNNFDHLLKQRENPLVIYAGQNISEDYLSELLKILDKHDYALTIISKSGTTTEPAIAFRILKKHIENKYGKEDARNRIIAITDSSKGALKQLADKENYKTFVIPDDVGGRYSVLTPVGLLPIAVAGFDIKKIMEGAKLMEEFNLNNNKLDENPILLYAAIRNILYLKGKAIEILINYEPKLAFFTEWWKQLFGESEGKENKGIFPAGANFTTDLHSLGQFIQEGSPNIFETTIFVDKPKNELKIPESKENLDKLNYLSGKNINEINEKAFQGTYMAHVDGNVANIVISIPQINENILGQLIYFFEMACAVSGYYLKVNPFDQPGVEKYKKNMFKLLGKH